MAFHLTQAAQKVRGNGGRPILTACGCRVAYLGFSGMKHTCCNDGGRIGSAGNRLGADERLEVNRLA